MKIVKSGVPANLTKRVQGKKTGNFGGAKSRLSSGVAQKQMCAKDRTRPLPSQVIQFSKPTAVVAISSSFDSRLVFLQEFFWRQCSQLKIDMWIGNFVSAIGNKSDARNQNCEQPHQVQ